MSAEDAEFCLHRADLDALFRQLADDGFEVIGPTSRDGAIVYDRLASSDDLPKGLKDVQAPGRYRLESTGDARLFAFSVGPQAWKRELHPPRARLFRAQRGDDGQLTVEGPPAPPPPKAFLGVRACELAAILIQDRVFLDQAIPDKTYADRRRQSLIIAVECGQAGGTCFCASVDTGPACGPGYDLALTEVLDDQGHRFVVKVGSPLGQRLADALPLAPASPEDSARRQAILAATEASMGRRMPTENLPEILRQSLESPHWESIAARCLSCANCTMVCPTCFCSTVEDVADLSGAQAERHRVWDSCFSLEFSAIHGGVVRASAAARYRQWMTHKLSSWHEQFGTSGCVGCGRCITWCPVGIDITQEAAALQAEHAQKTPVIAPMAASH